MPVESRSLKELFLAALAVAPAERSAWLGRACGEDVELRRRVELMLAAHDTPQSLLDRMAPAAEPPEQATGAFASARADGATTAGAEEAGAVIAGRYKLVEQIGEGGMGTVWMAQQTEPVKRLVALKVIKAGMDSKQVLARFEAERQALALMDHPNIARVLDGGTTAAGRPFFVMELVKGVSLTRYCDEHRLTPRQRLELFVPVCQAVQHAHQKGIIHRDLKPSNVMVCLYDGKPVPKVIDFGIAKAAGQQLTEHTLVTGFGAVVGTLEYMSPEQAELNQLDIDTRSDIYSLGVLLYELLTGSTPLEKKRLKAAAMLEVLRLIREEEPPRPSLRLSTTDEMPSVAANRGLEPKKLSGVVRGELDWIVMKALEKDRNRRYETANGFAMDVQRYLADEPVLACPPSVRYRLRKFVRRNKSKVTAAVAMLALVLAGAAASTWQAVRATLAEQETSKALAQVTAAQAQTREALDTLTDDVVQTMFAKQPELEEPEKAFLRKVLAAYEALAQQSGETAEAQFLRAKGYFKVAHLRELLGEQPQAVADYRQAALLLEQLVSQFPDVAEYRHKLARTNGNLGILLAEAGKEAESETAFRQAIALRTKLAEDFPKAREYRAELAKNFNDLAYLLERQEKYADAGKAYREALDLHEKLVAQAGDNPTHHQDLARARSSMGQWLRKQEKHTEAEKLYREGIKVQKEQVDKFPTVPRRRRQLADSYQGFGIVLAELGKEDESEQTFEESVTQRKKLADDFPSVLVYRRELASTYNDLGYLQSRRKKLADAERSYRRAVELEEKLVADGGALPAYRKLLSMGYTNLGNLLRDQKKDAQAEKAYRDSLQLDLKLIEEFPKAAEHHNGAANVLVLLALLHHGRKDFEGAVPLHTEARAHLKAALEISSKNPVSRKFYRDNLRLLAKSYLTLADHAKLATTGDDLAGFGYEPANDTCDAATMLASCVMLATKDAALGEAKRTELARGYADRALALLRQAIERGFQDAARMNQDPRLEPLRERPEFRNLLAELERMLKEKSVP